jgi:hypothetical protein
MTVRLMHCLIVATLGLALYGSATSQKESD